MQLIGGTCSEWLSRAVCQKAFDCVCMLLQGTFYREYVSGASADMLVLHTCWCAEGAQLLFLCGPSMHLTFGSYLLMTSGG